MMERPIFALILAAGRGTRMRSALPKVLHEVGGQSLINHALFRAQSLGATEILAVIPPDQEEIAGAISPIPFVIQNDPLGTADAVKSAMPALQRFADKHPDGDVFILFGDTPLLSLETLQKMHAVRGQVVPETGHLPSIVILGMRLEDGGAYGRILCEEGGNVKRIVEFRDASPAEQKETLCNSGVMVVEAASLCPLLKNITNHNRASEYYLTDIVQIARGHGLDCRVVEGHADEMLGVNSREDLAMVEAVFQNQKRHEFLKNGVTLRAPETIFFSHDTVIEADVVVEPHVVFGPGVSIQTGCFIDSFSHISGANIQAGSRIGPFARIRPGTHIGTGSRIGNFVEIKQSTLGEGVKINHLSYVGDAHIGMQANIGAGVITCNYNGFKKSPTYIGSGAFIGSNSALVAPVAIGDGAIIGAGSVVTQDVPANGLAKSRPPLEVLVGGADRFRTKHSTKASKDAADPSQIQVAARPDKPL